MKKLLCISALMVLVTTPLVHAEYRMVIGLENTSGGGLPDHSIVFINSGTTPITPHPEGDDYSIFGSFESVARAIVNNKNPVAVMTYETVKDVFTSGYNLNEYKRLQDFGYGYGLIATYVYRTDFNLNSLIALHIEGYNLIQLGQAGNYIESVYSIPLNTGIHKITSSYKASCWNSLNEVFTQIDISQWDSYAAQENCLK